MKLKSIEKTLTHYFYVYEYNRGREERRKQEISILPAWFLKQHILIKCNGNTVFDSFNNTDHMIPISVQYTILRYGLPERPKQIKKNKVYTYSIKTDMVSIG